MEVFTFVVIVVLIGCGTGIATTWIKSREEAKARAAAEAAPEALEDLRRRVEVLEQIVTDQSYELKREFNRLEENGR